MVCVFARKTSEPLTSLVKQIDSRIGEQPSLKAFVVLLAQGDKAADELRAVARDGAVKHVPLTLHQDPAGLPDYELARDADVTVLMWKGGAVKFNHAFKGALSDKDIKAVVDDARKLTGE